VGAKCLVQFILQVSSLSYHIMQSFVRPYESFGPRQVIGLPTGKHCMSSTVYQHEKIINKFNDGLPRPFFQDKPKQVTSPLYTSGIAYCLWRTGKNAVGLTSHNIYKPAIYTIIQCGAIYTSSIVVVCALHLARSPAGVMADYVGVQLAVNN
jgi:hypothetical protein